MIRRLCFALSITAVFATAIAPASARAALASNQTLTMAIPGEPTSLDPAVIAELDNVNISNALFIGLTKIRLDGTAAPSLASSWDVSSNGLKWTFHLRPANWSNGTPITATDVVNGVLRSLNPKTASGFSYQMFDIVGAIKYNEGKGTKAGVKVRAVNASTVEFTLNNRVPWFDQLVSIGVFYPIPSAVIAAKGSKWTEPANIVTSGPFHLAGWTHRSMITMTKSATYWDAANITLQQINMPMISATSTAFARYKAGTIDTGIPSAMIGSGQIAAAKKDDGYYAMPTASVQYAWFHSTKPALRKARIRRLLAQAIDRKKLVVSVTAADEEPASTFVPIGMPGYSVIASGPRAIKTTVTPKFATLKTQLIKAGWNPNTVLNVHFTTEGSDTSQKVAMQMKKDYAKVGVKTKLVAVKSAATLYALSTRPIPPKIDIMLLGWIADYNDPYNFLSLLTNNSSYNVSEWTNSAFTNLVYGALDKSSVAARNLAYKKAEAILTGSSGSFPAAPLYQGVEKTMVQSWVSGFAIGFAGTIDLSPIQIQDH